MCAANRAVRAFLAVTHQTRATCALWLARTVKWHALHVLLLAHAGTTRRSKTAYLIPVHRVTRSPRVNRATTNIPVRHQYPLL